MDDENFLESMRSLSAGPVCDLSDALVFAMQQVAANPNHFQQRYFGRVGDGIFYMDGNLSHTRWFPETTPTEALGLLRCEFGDRFVRGLEEQC